MRLLSLLVTALLVVVGAVVLAGGSSPSNSPADQKPAEGSDGRPGSEKDVDPEFRYVGAASELFRPVAREATQSCGRLIFTTYHPATQRGLLKLTSLSGGSETLLRAKRRHLSLYETAWSPSGRHVAFVGSVFDEALADADDELYLVRTDGSRIRRLTDQVGDVVAYSWSPSGRRVVIQRVVGDRSEIRLVDLRGREEVIAFGQDPKWSPDGRWIAYSTREGPLFNSHGELYRIPAGGGAPDQLTFPKRAWDMYPRWSSDSRSLIFERHPRGQHGQDGPYADIWLLDVASGSERRLTFRQDDLNGSCCGRLSPDGSLLAYMIIADDFGKVVLQSTDARRALRVFGRGWSYSSSPEWSPDGKLLAMSWGGISVFDPQSGERRVLNPGEDSSQIRWGPC